MSIPEQGHRVMRGLAALILVSAFTACTTARIDVARHSKASIDADLGVVVLARQHDGGQDTEESFMDCVTGALSDGETPISLYPEQDFVDALFPWFEPRIAPTTPEALPALLNRPGVGEKIMDIGVRYLVWVDGTSERVDGGGGMSCAVGPGGGGCLGFVWWDTASDYEAVIWDLQGGESLGAVSADATGMSYVPALIVPLPLIARTQAAACRGLAEQLRGLLDGDDAL
jgi:hypothetical protein